MFCFFKYIQRMNFRLLDINLISKIVLCKQIMRFCLCGLYDENWIFIFHFSMVQPIQWWDLSTRNYEACASQSLCSALLICCFNKFYIAPLIMKISISNIFFVSYLSFFLVNINLFYSLNIYPVIQFIYYFYYVLFTNRCN